MSRHLAARASIEKLVEHVYFQLPSAQTTVKCFLHSIVHSNASLRAAIDIIRNYDGPTDKLNDFELAVTCLLSCDHAAKRRKVISSARHSIADSTTSMSST